MRSLTFVGPLIDWSVSSAVRRTDGIDAIAYRPRGSVLARRAAPPASSSACERPMRPPTAQAAALGLCCLLAGQPLCHHERPEAAFLWRGARLRQHPRRTAPADGQLRLPTAQQAPIVRPRLTAGRATRTSFGPRRESVLCSQELVDASSTSLCLGFDTLHFHSQAAKAGIAIAASAETLKLVLLQRGAFVLYLGVEYESRSIRALTAAAQQKR